MMRYGSSTRFGRAAVAALLACAGCGSDGIIGPTASVAALELSLRIAPDTVVLHEQITVELRARNPLDVPMRVRGPCPASGLALQVTGADGVEWKASVNPGGCKVPGPATTRLDPGASIGISLRTDTGALLPPGAAAGTYRVRAVYEGPDAEALGPEVVLTVQDPSVT